MHLYIIEEGQETGWLVNRGSKLNTFQKMFKKSEAWYWAEHIWISCPTCGTFRMMDFEKVEHTLYQDKKRKWKG